MPGKLPALHDRFANHTMQLFKKHGIDNVAYWTEDIGTSNRLVYMLGYPGFDVEKGWTAFQADPAWQQARAESEKNGPLVRVSRHSSCASRPIHRDSKPAPIATVTRRAPLAIGPAEYGTSALSLRAPIARLCIDPILGEAVQVVTCSIFGSPSRHDRRTR